MAAASITANTLSAIASRRTLRLALGTALSMGFSQLVNWPLSFMAAIFTLLILATPLPRPSLKSGLKFTLALVLPAYAGMLLVPFLLHARWAGILLVVMALYGSFYYSARGGSPVLGMFMTIGLTMVVTVGSVSADIMLLLVNGIAVGAAAGIVFVIIAHALLPDLPAPATLSPEKKPPAPPKPALSTARRNALRSLSVVLPLVLIFLFSSSSIAYIPIMIKVASMGQQASVKVSRSMGREQIESTLWGGLGAVIGYQLMGIMPSSLTLFCLIIALACLLYGSQIFHHAGMNPRAAMWSYALLTMIIILTPAVIGSGDAGSAFYTRLLLFIIIAIYGTISVSVFDAFWPDKPEAETSPALT